MGARGAPNKKGLDYFPKMLNFYDDDKIFDLMDEYGPLGVTVYDVILTIVYSQGYYAELSKGKLSRMVIRKIGNKWIKGGQKVVVQVIDYCAELGLLHEDLLGQSIITSEGIQKRYYKIAVKLMKRQLYNDKYWLLDKEEKEEPLLNSPLNRINSEENRISSEEIPINSEEMHTKEKETKSIYIFTLQELASAFDLYVMCRKQNGEALTDEQIELLKEELCSLSADESEQLAIVKKATVSNWKSFYPLSKKKKEAEQSKKQSEIKNKFNNFEGRKYDMDALEGQLLDVNQKV